MDTYRAGGDGHTHRESLWLPAAGRPVPISRRVIPTESVPKPRPIGACARSAGPCLDPNCVQAVDLDDIGFADEVEILTTSGLPALCPPDSHHFDEPTVIEYPISFPDMAGDRDLR